MGDVHEIEYHNASYRVEVRTKTCGCGYWQLNGIPCMHAMCVITTTKLNLDDYVSDYYLTAKWRQLYAKGMEPVQGMKLWKRLVDYQFYLHHLGETKAGLIIMQGRKVLISLQLTSTN